MSLTDKFPTEVETPQGAFKVCTDFRDWIRFSQMLASDLSDEDKLLISTEYYLKEIPTDATVCLVGLCSFYSRKSYEEVAELFKPHKRTPKKPSYSFEVDADCIMAGFLATYGIDLENVPYMHWHKFMALLENLPEETEFRHRVAVRNTNLAKIKDADERARLRKYYNSIKIAERPSDEEIGSLFW